MVSRVKGTQDFLDLTVFNFVIDQVQRQLKDYNFTEISTPILEPLSLFKRSLGEYTDVVSKEMFVIQSHDKDAENLICLRPEATASTVRAFIENNIIQTPWKVYSWGPMFRYERPQKGRYRQFHQVTIEIIGSAAIEQDVQLIKMLDRLFHERFKLNNYALLLNFIGCFEDRKAYQQILKDFLETPLAETMCDTCKVRKERNILRIFDCKNLTCIKIYKEAPFIADNLCTDCNDEWQTLQKNLRFLSVNFICDPTLVRGLDYYNKTVFEFVSENLGAQNAFCGGGRYDQLVGQLGAKQDQPSIGAAIGLERLVFLVEQNKERLLIPQKPALHVIAPLTEQQKPLALLIADELQAQNLCTDVLFDGSVKSMMRKANKMGAAYVLMLGDEEQQNKTVTVKNMLNGEQTQVNQADVVAYLKK